MQKNIVHVSNETGFDKTTFMALEGKLFIQNNKDIYILTIGNDDDRRCVALFVNLKTGNLFGGSELKKAPTATTYCKQYLKGHSFQLLPEKTIITIEHKSDGFEGI